VGIVQKATASTYFENIVSIDGLPSFAYESGYKPLLDEIRSVERWCPPKMILSHKEDAKKVMQYIEQC
jgi:DNA-directed RNA polymerase subunit N (RpoN/RPB10)